MDCIISAIIITIAAALVAPIFMKAREPSRKPNCQANLKVLVSALTRYANDYDKVLPGSMLCGGSKIWNNENFTRFAKEKGSQSARPGAPCTWPMLLCPYTSKYDDSCWCPSDPVDRDNPNASVSYYWKAAVDKAWYGGFRSLRNFKYPADQIVFYEHNGWHWGNSERGLTNGVIINCAFLDGHVRGCTIRNSGYTQRENPPEPLPKSGVGEPAWFNYRHGSSKSGNDRGQNWNPEMWRDDLP